MKRLKPALYLFFLFPTLLLCNGCVFFTANMNGIGKNYEYPQNINTSKGPIIEAYSNEDNSKLCIKYEVKIGDRFSPKRFPKRKKYTRWINIDKQMILDKLPKDFAKNLPKKNKMVHLNGIALQRGEKYNILRLYGNFLNNCVSNKPKWPVSKLKKINTCSLIAKHTPSNDSSVGISVSHSKKFSTSYAYAYFLMDLPETEDKDIIRFEFPRKPYREIWSRVTKPVLIPTGIALDIVTAPIQGACVILIIIALNGI